ncbi:MAG: Hpt domain-containing protein [Polyangiales bacterium]
MSDDLWSAFGERFIATAKKRLENLRRLQGWGAWNHANEMADDLHALAGEAAVIGRATVADRARACEAIARRLMSTHDEHLSASLDGALAELERSVSDLS